MSKHTTGFKNNGQVFLNPLKIRNPTNHSASYLGGDSLLGNVPAIHSTMYLHGTLLTAELLSSPAHTWQRDKREPSSLAV